MRRFLITLLLVVVTTLTLTLFEFEYADQSCVSFPYPSHFLFVALTCKETSFYVYTRKTNSKTEETVVVFTSIISLLFVLLVSSYFSRV